MNLLVMAMMIVFFAACAPITTPKALPTSKTSPVTLLSFPKIYYDKPPFRPANLDAIGAQLGSPIYMRIFKAEQILELWIKVGKAYKLLNTYPILKTSGILGPKEYEGDRQNPEGIYFVTKGRLNRFSKYHLAINIGYPNKLDRELGRTGSFIMIHGNKKSIGCFAMGDAGIEDIYPIAYTALDLGQRAFQVAIYPFIMNEKNMQDYAAHPWYDFWQELKVGYDLFEAEHLPPRVTMREGHYIFTPYR